MTDIINDKRHFHRIFYNADVTLSNDSCSHPCKLVDISLKGCLLKFESPWTAPLEDIYTLTLQLSDDVSITMQVSVAHVIGDEA